MASEPSTESESYGTIETRMRVLLDDSDGRPLVDRVERTGLGLEGMIESTEIRLTRAGCGHIIHTGAEAGAVCAEPTCGTVLCNACAAKDGNTCTGCGRTVCVAHQRKHWLLGDDGVYCGPCWRDRWSRELLIAGTVAAVAFLVLFFASL